MYFNKCPYCGSNNDPDERCDCGGMKIKHKMISLKQQARRKLNTKKRK